MDRPDPDQVRTDAAGPFAGERECLVPMSTLASWTLSEGEPDIRGWEVRTIGGRRLGLVGDLLIDDAAREVVFLDIHLSAGNRRTFVPARVVLIDRARQLILMDSADLPDSDAARDDRAGSAGRSAADGGTVRYPGKDREVARERPLLADDAPHAAPPASERRRAERRRIDRMSTEF
jgi:PRC-barrel domain